MHAMMMAEPRERNSVPGGDARLANQPPNARPALLLAIGPTAEQVAEQAAAVSAQWLSITPPLWRLATMPAEPAERSLLNLRRQISTICTEIATRTAATEAWRSSAPAQAQTTLQVWLLLELPDDEAGGEVEISTAAVEAHIGWALQSLQLLDVVAWQQLRLALTPQCLLLLNTAHHHRLTHCRRLATMLPAPFYLMGWQAPEAATTAWQERAATTLAALLWTDELTAHKPAPVVAWQPAYYTVGATAWLPPTAAIKRLLALLTARDLIHFGLAEQPSGSTTDTAAGAPADGATDREGAALCALAEEVLRSGEMLSALVPAPAPIRLRRRQPWWWRTALAPVNMLIAHNNLQQNQQRTAGRQARQQWLTTQLARWEAAWQPFNRAQLIFGMGADHFAAYEATLLHLRQRLLGRAQAVDDWLTGLADTLAHTATRVQAASTALAAFCTDLPTPSLYGGWHFCRHPTQWPRWSWQLTCGLPWRLRTLSRALTIYEQAGYDEANGHALRQLGMALAQDVQLQILWLQELRGQLKLLATYLDEQIASSLSTLPAPVDLTQIDALRRQLWHNGSTLPPESKAELAGLLQRETADQWTDATLETLGETVIGWVESAFSALDTWTVDDWLHALFPATPKGAGRNGAKSQPATPPALTTWLNTLADQAAPLWSPTANASVGWLVTPARRTDHFDVDAWIRQQPPHPGVAAWLQTHPTWQAAASAIPGLVVIQWHAVG